MSVILACRGCRTPIQGDGGCALCQDFKKNLVVIGDSPVDEVDLGDLASEVLSLMRKQLKGLRAKMDALPRDSVPPNDLLNATTRLSRSIASMVGETRKVRQEGIAALKGISFQDKLDLFLTWVEELPTVHRDHLLRELKDTVQAVQTPAHLAVVE